MRGSRKNRLRVPRETCVGVDVGSAVGRRGGREICEFFFLTFERTRACWSRAAICKNWRSEQTQNKERSTVQLEKGNADRGRGSGSDWGSDRDRSSGAREPNCQKPWYRSQTHTHTRAHRANLQRRAPFLSRDFFTLSYESEQHKKRKMFAKSLLKKVNIR